MNNENKKIVITTAEIAEIFRDTSAQGWEGDLLTEMICDGSLVESGEDYIGDADALDFIKNYANGLSAKIDFLDELEDSEISEEDMAYAIGRFSDLGYDGIADYAVEIVKTLREELLNA